MPQRLKEEVRVRLVASAAAVFAEKGYMAAKLSEVAIRANTSTSNIYKYYENKESLFDEIVTPALAGRFMRLLRARVRELGSLRDWRNADASGSDTARALLGFWVEHRLVVLILLRGCEGTRYGHLRGLIVHELQRLASGYTRARQGEAAVSPALEFVLEKLFARTVDMIADILERYDDPASIARAFALFWRYQLAGLQELLSVERPASLGADCH